jgi:AcrR family transcriptional regulator
VSATNFGSRGARGSANPRRYRSALRDEQARTTRRRIVDAACELFVERGYGPTTIDAIAERAGVGRKTVFTSAGGKAALLKLGFDWAVAGDDEPVALADRPRVREMLELTDPAALLAAWIGMNAEIAARLAPLYHVVVVAADADPDAARLLEVTDGQRMDGARRTVERLHELGGLRADLDTDAAAAIADVLLDPTPCQRFIRLHGWTAEAYAAHLQHIAAASLLAHRPAPKPKPQPKPKSKPASSAAPARTRRRAPRNR